MSRPLKLPDPPGWRRKHGPDSPHFATDIAVAALAPVLNQLNCMTPPADVESGVSDGV
jgi:hypothetical protein